MNVAIAAVSCLLPMLALDGLWLNTMLKRFYAPRMVNLLSDTPSLVPAGIFYLIYAAGLSVLIVLPSVKNGDGAMKVFLRGALFGFVCYATYDLTNQATLKAWSSSLTLVDMAWGAFLTGTASLGASASARRLS